MKLLVMTGALGTILLRSPKGIQALYSPSRAQVQGPQLG
jgi:hypothetical protein